MGGGLKWAWFLMPGTVHSEAVFPGDRVSVTNLGRELGFEEIARA